MFYVLLLLIKDLNDQLRDNEKLLAAGLISGPEAAVVQLGILSGRRQQMRSAWKMHGMPTQQWV